MHINRSDSQIIALFMSKVRDPINSNKPWKYRVAYHQEIKFRLAFQAPSTVEATIGLQEFQGDISNQDYWIPTINDNILLFAIDLNQFRYSESSIDDYIVQNLVQNNPIGGATLFFVGQLMSKPQQNVPGHSVFITAQDIMTTGLKRHVRGFRKAVPQIFGVREKELAVAAVSGKELDTALRSYYNRSNFIGFKNTFESFRGSSNNDTSGWSVGLNSDGVEEYTDMQRRNLLFNSHEFDGLSTVLNYNFTQDQEYKLRDYDDNIETDVMVVDLIQSRSEVTTVPFATKYAITIREHTIESDYFFNFGGNDGYEVFEQPSTSMDRIFGKTWTTMMQTFKENIDKGLIAQYKTHIKLELDKLACYRVFRDIMQMSQIMASIHGIPLMDTTEGIKLCHPGMRFAVDINNNKSLIRSIVKDTNMGFDYVVNRVEGREFAETSGQGNRETNIYLVLIPKALRELFNSTDRINILENGRSLAYIQRFYSATEWLRMPDLVQKAEDATKQVTLSGLQGLQSQSQEAEESAESSIQSVPSRVSAEFYTNLVRYKDIYKKQLWLAGLGDIQITL